MRSRDVSRRWPCILWLAASLLLLGAGAPPAAMVSDLVGKATLRGQNVALFAMVDAGSELELPAGSRLQLAFVNGGLVVSATGPCTLRVEADGAHVLKGTPVSSRKPAPSAVGVKPTGINWDKMAGLRRGELTLRCDPASLSEDVELTWKADRPLEEIEVVVEEAGTFKRVVKKLVPATPAACKVALSPGGSYLVTLTGFTASGERFTTGPVPLHVLSLAERTGFESSWKAAWEAARSDPQEAGGLALLLAQATELQLYAQAREVAAELVKRRPEDPGLKRLVEALP